MEYNDTALDLERTSRNNWGKSIEEQVRGRSHLPISYDVDCTQPLSFTEYTYTEFLGGVFIKTQNTEINVRLFNELKEIKAQTNHLDKLKGISGDKYKSVSPIERGATQEELPKKICFFVGENMLDMISKELVGRLAFENDDFFIKLHPLTGEKYAAGIAHIAGWHRVIQQEISAFELLKAAETVYSSSASELAAAAVVYDKEIVNVANFFHESNGSYYSINKFLFQESDKEKRKEILNNLIDNKSSGLLFPWMDDIEERLKCFYDKTEEMRQFYKPLASPSFLKKPPAREISKEEEENDNKAQTKT
jgi:hypothetical protein